MNSMTGFGQAAGDDGRHTVTVTLRGVNHRFLELRLHLSDEQRSVEEALRSLLSTQLSRGRVEVGVEVRAVVSPQVQVRVDREVVQAAHGAVGELLAEGLVAGGMAVGDLLRLPEALVVERTQEAWTEEGDQLLLSVAGKALEQMLTARRVEGESLRGILRQRISSLQDVVTTLEERRRKVRETMASALRTRLDDVLADTGLEESRLVQEVAILVEKGDVAEELDRLGSHCSHFEELFESPEPVGKRMDFLAQEMGRELNTVGAKCRDATMTRSVLDGKLLCEQVREQVQNVE